jgi:hypothetical protein
VDEYLVEMKPGFDQEKYAKIISKHVKGKVGYVFEYSDAFTIYDISEADVARIREMPEVKSVTKLGYGQLAMAGLASNRRLGGLVKYETAIRPRSTSGRIHFAPPSDR